MNPPLPYRRLRFGPFVLDTRRVELQREGVQIPLRPKPFALLMVLVGHPGTVLSRAELFAAVWPGTVVSDDSLTQAVREVRVALGDAGATMLRTVARHGYRFDAEVVDADADGLPARPDEPAPQGAVAAPPPAGDHPSPVRKAALSSSWLNHVFADGRLTPVARRVGALALTGLVLAAGALRPDQVIVGLADRMAQTLGGRSGAAGGHTAPRLSLVVLPLGHEADSEGGDGFSDPLTADLTADLGKVSGLFVISRETAFSYKGQPIDPRTVARELNVRYVVRGTVGRTSNRVGLAMSLVDGETGRQVWAGRFDLDRADLANSLRDLTGALSRSVGVEVYRAEGQRAATLGPQQLQADDLAMHGWSVWMRGFSRENTFEALRLFDAAVSRDPDSLRAWSGVALMNATAANHGWATDPESARARQREGLRQMERIDSEDMLTYFARVDPFHRRQDFEGLLRLARTLVARFPNHPWSHHQHAAALMQLGRFDACIAPAEQALRLGPRDTLRWVVRGMAAFCHFGAGRHGPSLDQARQAVQDSPTQPLPQLMLAAALALDGQDEAAQRVVQENLGRPAFRQESLRRLLTGTDPRLVQARERLFRTLGKLGVP